MSFEDKSIHNSTNGKDETDSSAALFRRKLLTYSAIGILIFTFVIVIFSVGIIYNNLHEYATRAFQDIARVERMAVEEWLRHIKDMAWQITSRTRIREELERYEKGYITLERLRDFTKPKLEDAIRLSHEIFGIVRLDNLDRIVVVCGSKRMGLSTIKYIKEKRIKNEIGIFPIDVDGRLFIAVAAPIRKVGGEYLGTDIVFFDIKNLKDIVETGRYSNVVNDILVGYKRENKILAVLFPSESYLEGGTAIVPGLATIIETAISGKSGFVEWKDKIVAFTPIGERSGWGLLVLDERSRFYKPLYRRVFLIILIFFAVSVLFLIGLRIVTKPLAGRLLIHTKRFEKIIEDRTRALKEEIEKRKKIEKELKESREEYKKISQLKRAILESPRGIIVFALDREYRYLDFTLLHKLTMKEIWEVDIEVGKSMLEYIRNERDRLKAKENFDRALRGESFVLYEEYGDEKLKRTFYEDRYSPIYDDEENIIGVAVFVVDITELKRAEEALKESKENLRITLKSIGDGVIAVDTEGRITGMNPIAESLTEWGKEEAMGRPIDEVFYIINEETRKPAENPVERALREGRIVGLANHSVLVSRSGKEYNIADSAAPIVDDSGNIHGVVLVFRDVTEKMRVEKELSKIRRLESVGLLAGGIAHDFNNILTGIFGNIELARLNLPKDSQAVEYLQIAQEAMEKAMGLTKQLLTFAKGGEPILESVSTREIVESTVKFVLSGSNIKVEFDFQDGLWPIKADKGQISQVITNLTINAKEAMPEGGTLYVKARNFKGRIDTLTEDLKKPFVELTFRDEGIGIAEKHIDKIFDPYFTTKQAGTGLGLAVVHSIVSKHDGYIKVNSKEGIGTIFTIYLPADESFLSKSREKGGKMNLEGENEIAKKRVLILDDDPVVLRVVERMVELLGFEVETVRTGEEAIDLYGSARENGVPFDVVITDLTIPGELGGKEVANELLKIDPNARVIVSSGYSTDPVMSNYSEYGFAGRVSKPFKLEDLKEEILRVLSS